MTPFLPLLLVLSLHPAPPQAPAQKAPRAQAVDPVKKLEALQKELEALVDLLRDRIDVEALRAGLKNRTPNYRVVKPPAPEPAPAEGEKPETPKASPGTPPSRESIEAKRVKAPPVPAEKAGGPGDVVLEADGIPITRGEIEKISGFIMSYSPDLPPEECQKKALESLIARAHVESVYKDRLQAMKKKIAAIRKRIVEKGDIFADVAREVSDCPSKSRGGDLGEVSHGQMVQPFELYAYRTPKGQVSPIFLTPFGYHILKVIQEPRGMDPASMKVRVRHILVAFDKNVGKLQNLIREARQGKVKLKVLDPSIEPAIPSQYPH